MSESTHHAPAPNSTPQPEQIYRIVDPSTITPMGNTWLLNPQLTYTSDQSFFAIPFYSNGKLYKTLSHYYQEGSHNLFYDRTKVNRGDPLWANDEYRVISFTATLDKNLLAWLTANGVQIYL